MADYLDRKVDEILKYLNCNTIDEGLKKLDELINEQKEILNNPIQK